MSDPAGEAGFGAHVRSSPERLALVAGEERESYAELDARADRWAAVLAARGLGPGGRVALVLPNGAAFFEVWVAASKLGASVVPVNRHLKAEELSYVLRDSAARVLVTDPRFDDARRAARGLGAACEVVTVAPGEGPPRRALAAATPELFEVVALAPPVFYTSGTTGRPKGVVHGSFDGERARQAQLGQVALWGWTRDDVNLLCGPAYHAGPGGFVMTGLFAGATSVLMEQWDARAFLRLVERHRVTLAFMAPAHFIRVLEVPKAERAARDLSSLRLVVHGGAPCPVPVKERILDALAPAEVWELYGASEGGATRIGPDEWRRRPGSVGRPWPGVEIRILADGRTVPAGETGLVHVRPAGGARFHYHGDRDQTDGSWVDGAFTVGDVGHLDDDGYLYLTDRASDLVIRGGVNIYPREIEEVLHRHPAVVDCAVFGAPDERLGEHLVALVEVRAPVEPAALRAFVGGHLADFKVPAEVEIVDELPRAPNGKVLKRALRASRWRGHDRPIG